MDKNQIIYVGMSDLVERWTYTRMGANKVIHRDDFPAPAFIINKGRVKVWLLSEVEAYEKDHKALVDAGNKFHKMRWYAAHMQSGEYSKPERLKTRPDPTEYGYLKEKP